MSFTVLPVSDCVSTPFETATWNLFLLLWFKHVFLIQWNYLLFFVGLVWSWFFSVLEGVSTQPIG